MDGGIVFRTPEREGLTLPVAQTLQIQTVVVPRTGLSLTRYEDLNGLNIGVTRGTMLNDRFDADESLIRVEVNSYKQLVKMMAAGRLDAIAGSLNSIAVELKKADVEASVNLAGSLSLGWREQWLQLSRKSEHVQKIAALALATKDLREEGVFDRIMDKYYGEKWRLVSIDEQSN